MGKPGTPSAQAPPPAGCYDCGKEQLVGHARFPGNEERAVPIPLRPTRNSDYPLMVVHARISLPFKCPFQG